MNETVMVDVSTVRKKIETIVFNTLKDRIKGHVYAKMEEKANDKDIDTLHIDINSNGIYYTEQLKLPGDTFAMVSQSDSYAETLGLMIYDNFKKFIENKFFSLNRPKKFTTFKKREN